MIKANDGIDFKFVYSSWYISLCIFTLCLSLLIWLRYGEGDFDKVIPKGPFRVGVKRMYSKKDGFSASHSILSC
jgi:hypothetical protein